MKVSGFDVDFSKYKKDFTCWVVGDIGSPTLRITEGEKCINIHFKSKGKERKYFQGCSSVDLILIQSEVSKDIMNECLLRVYTCGGKLYYYHRGEFVLHKFSNICF